MSPSPHFWVYSLAVGERRESLALACRLLSSRTEAGSISAVLSWKTDHVYLFIISAYHITTFVITLPQGRNTN